MFNDLQFALGRKLKQETLIQVKNSHLLERGMVMMMLLTINDILISSCSGGLISLAWRLFIYANKTRRIFKVLCLMSQFCGLMGHKVFWFSFGKRQMLIGVLFVVMSM